MSPCTVIQTPVSSGSKSWTSLVPAARGRAPRPRSSWRRMRRVALPRQDAHARIVGHEVGQQAVALLDTVVVVRDGLAGLDGAVLGRGLVRRLARQEPGRVEAHLPAAVRPGERGDMAELHDLRRRDGVLRGRGRRRGDGDRLGGLVAARATRCRYGEDERECSDRPHAYFANSTARLSRMTVTFTWPGYSSWSSISRAISWLRRIAASSSISAGFTITRISRPAWSA